MTKNAQYFMLILRNDDCFYLQARIELKSLKTVLVFETLLKMFRWELMAFLYLLHC